jgi:hypothetical protein
VQAPKEEHISPDKFLRNMVDPIMQGYPGATFHLDLRQGFPKPIFEYYVTLLPQDLVEHKVHLWDGSNFDAPAPEAAKTRTYPSQQPSEAEAVGVKGQWGETTKGPLGWIVHARSGDKGSNANVGFWVRHTDEWEWLRSLLSTEAIKGLLADEYKGKKIVSITLGQQSGRMEMGMLTHGVGSIRTSGFVGCALPPARPFGSRR